VQGVRRWISSHPSTPVSSRQRKPTERTEQRKVTIPVEIDRYSSGSLAKLLLDPTVSDSEVAEYQGCTQNPCADIHPLTYFLRYIDQYEDMLSTHTADLGEKKDLEIYSLAIRAGLGELPDDPETPPREFVNYVEQVNRASRDSVAGAPAGGGGYERWLTASYT